MRRFTRILGAGALLALLAMPAYADVLPLTEKVLGKTDAPIRVDEYVSLTCSHCAEFYNVTLPELEKKYVDGGKVKFVMHDFPLDAYGLKAAQLARCMPPDEFFPFVKMIYKNQAEWTTSTDPEKTLISYTKLGGLTEDQAKACLQNTKLQDAIVAERDEASQKYQIEATPTFVINDGADMVKGAMPPEEFGKIFDKMLAAKH